MFSRMGIEPISELRQQRESERAQAACLVCVLVCVLGSLAGVSCVLGVSFVSINCACSWISCGKGEGQLCECAGVRAIGRPPI